MKHIFPKSYPFPDNFETYDLEVTWLPNNPLIYDLTPKVKVQAIEAPKQFSYNHNPGNLGMRLWNSALRGSDTDVAFAVGNKMITVHLCALNAESETPVFNTCLINQNSEKEKPAVQQFQIVSLKSLKHF
jgi:hypothetical protein